MSVNEGLKNALGDNSSPEEVDASTPDPIKAIAIKGAEEAQEAILKETDSILSEWFESGAFYNCVASRLAERAMPVYDSKMRRNAFSGEPRFNLLAAEKK